MRKILLALSLKYNGNFYQIKDALVRKEKLPKEEIENVESKINCKYITILDPEYPEKLKTGFMPPIVIYYYGNIELLKHADSIAIIGSRKNSPYGEYMTKKIVKELKEFKPCIISGLALGIDCIAHKQALTSKIPTIAILGSGIDNCYPSSNIDVYNIIKEKGLILSEYPNNIEPKPENFLIRNRIIAALSEKILVVEANYQSGTMNTVTYGLEYGKDIYAVPYLATGKSGCNKLIKEGAKLVESGKDVYE